MANVIAKSVGASLAGLGGSTRLVAFAVGSSFGARTGAAVISGPIYAAVGDYPLHMAEGGYPLHSGVADYPLHIEWE